MWTSVSNWAEVLPDWYTRWRETKEAEHISKGVFMITHGIWRRYWWHKMDEEHEKDDFLNIYLFGYTRPFAACGIFSCAMWTLSWGMWDTVPQPEIEPRPPVFGAWSLSHWTTREVPEKMMSSEIYRSWGDQKTVKSQTTS